MPLSNSNNKGRPAHVYFSPEQEQYIANLLAIPRNWPLLIPNNAGTSSSDDSLTHQEIKGEIRKRLLKAFNARFDANLTYNQMKAKIWGMINLWRIANKELETSGPSQKDKVLKMCHYFDILSPAISESRKLSPIPPLLPHPSRPSPKVYRIADDDDNEGIDEVMLQGFIQRPKESEPLEKKRRLSEENNAGASPSKEGSTRVSSSERKGTRASPSEEMDARACSSKKKVARASPSDEKGTKASNSGEKGARASSSEGKGTRASPPEEMSARASPSDQKGTRASLPDEKGPRSSPSEEKSAGASSSSGAGASPSMTLQVEMAVQQQQQKDRHHNHHQDWQKRMASEQLKLDEMKVNMLQQALDIDKRMRDLQDQTMVAVLQRAQSEMQRAQAEMQRTLAQATKAQIEVKIVQAEVLKAQAEVQKAQAEARIAEAEEKFRKAQISSKMAGLRSDGLEMVNGYFKI
ncbi:hypothetical protein BGZ80_005075 [Entomortierella chlamydospora]|uniref:Uncharacterized protein n=1 Tax=Entomortierella chlamydospora TaxID=101097 RepID=A0A9P6N0A7_9FUNG|nr:hypothetical protein BGZ79_006125 [Entomortierella chlamydospora]KAG0019924.1 hypothetical protein BGZ80_005075 [Entomortierella chlamydospora]